MNDNDFFRNTELGKAAEKREAETGKSKPKTEDIERDFLKISIDRRRTDGVIEVNISGSSDPTEFHIQDGKIVYGTVLHYGQLDIDKKADDKLLQVHANTILALIEEDKI